MAQFFTDDWDDEPDVPIDNFFWKDADFKAKLETSAIGPVVVIYKGEEEPQIIEAGDVAAALRILADQLTAHYQGAVLPSAEWGD